MDTLPAGRALVAGLVSAAVAAVPHPLMISDYDTVVFANAPACEIMRARTLDELVGQPADRFVHPDIREAYALRKPLIVERRQSIRDVPTKFVALDGSAIVGRSHLISIEFDGRPSVMWVYHGIAKAARDGGPDIERAYGAEKCALVFDALPQCMLIHDNERILAANAACRWILGARSPEELVGRPIQSIVHPDGRTAGAVRRSIIAVSNLDRLEGVAVKLMRVDGRELRLQVDAHCVDFDGHRACLVTTGMA